MAEYRATSKTFVDGVLYPPGAKFHTDAKPSKTWEEVGEKRRPGRPPKAKDDEKPDEGEKPSQTGS